MKRRDAIKRLLLAPLAAAVGVKAVEEIKPKTGSIDVMAGIPKDVYLGGLTEWKADIKLNVLPDGGFMMEPEFAETIADIIKRGGKR